MDRVSLTEEQFYKLSLRYLKHIQSIEIGIEEKGPRLVDISNWNMSLKRKNQQEVFEYNFEIGERMKFSLKNFFELVKEVRIYSYGQFLVDFVEDQVQES